jgi:SRSO17 transposase
VLVLVLHQYERICSHVGVKQCAAPIISFAAIEHQPMGEKKYNLANLPAQTDLRTLAAAIKARWICEQAHQQLKEELGLDHFEGRSCQGLHRRALMTMIGYTFLSPATASAKPSVQQVNAIRDAAR